MNLNLDSRVSANYKNNSQITRVVTENWAAINAYCPRCGHSLSKFENNRPVADFYCPDCFEEFELKSKHAESIGGKIVDGAYKSMIERISSSKNPNFFFLTYNRYEMVVINFMIIPKFFFVHQIIEKRKPLFYLSDIYSFEPMLKERHPNNPFVKDKIRQQLQILRDRGFIEFLGNGKYRKVV